MAGTPRPENIRDITLEVDDIPGVLTPHDKKRIEGAVRKLFSFMYRDKLLKTMVVWDKEPNARVNTMTAVMTLYEPLKKPIDYRKLRRQK